MDTFEHFYLVDDGRDRWRVIHQITDIPAGSIRRTAGGFHLWNEHGRTVGTFASVDEAILRLYATV